MPMQISLGVEAVYYSIVQVENSLFSSQLTTTMTMLKLLWPLPIVNLRIPGLIGRGTASFVQNKTTIILLGDIR